MRLYIVNSQVSDRLALLNQGLFLSRLLRNALVITLDAMDHLDIVIQIFDVVLHLLSRQIKGHFLSHFGFLREFLRSLTNFCRD